MGVGGNPYLPQRLEKMELAMSESLNADALHRFLSSDEEENWDMLDDYAVWQAESSIRSHIKHHRHIGTPEGDVLKSLEDMFESLIDEQSDELQAAIKLVCKGLLQTQTAKR